MKPAQNPRCPECGKRDQTLRVVCMGFPMKHCDRCELVWGFWSFVLEIVGYDGWMLIYEKGELAKTVWQWFTTNPPEDEE